MKRGLLFVVVFLLSMSFAFAVCTDSDGGQAFQEFGFTTDDSGTQLDTCSSDTQLIEYFCSAGSIQSTSHTCAEGCVGGQCVPASCTNLNECNPGLRKWCAGGAWSSSAYCTDQNLQCFLFDSSCGFPTCEEGACDYNAHKYCENNQWVGENYCDASRCGNNLNSQDFCFCLPESDTELSCSDGVDNDCDGFIDCSDSECSGEPGCECLAGESQACGSDVGECSIGTQQCQGGSWGVCSGQTARDEICDGLDNDCDGEIDEQCTCLPGETRDCGENQGVCQGGVQTCQDDGTWSICFGASYAASQIEDCDGLDDDCDGVVDEGCGCVAGSTQACGSDVGSCSLGTQTCVNGSWQGCMGQIDPFPEVCGDLLDNDCDGLVDYDDDNCGAPPVIEETSEEEIVLEEELECITDLDCDFGFVCNRNECLEEKTEEDNVDIETDSTSSDPSTAESSSLLSTSDFTSDEDSGPNLLIVIIPFILLILIFVAAYALIRRRKKKIVGSKREKKVATPKQPVQQMRLEKQQIKPQRRSKAELELEKSLKESRKLLRKK